MPEKKQRIEFIDLAKGFCILLVIILHLVPASANYSDRFSLECLRMPLYFCLSGLFFKDYGSFKKFFLKKTNNILIPFLGWYLISYLIFYVGAYTIMSDLEVKHHYLDVFRGEAIYNGPIWFLICLFWSNIIFYIIYRIFKKWIWQFVAVALCALGGYLWSVTAVNNFFYLGTCLSCMPFFFVGYTLKNILKNLPDKMSKKEYAVMSLCLIFFVIIALFPDSRAHYSFVENKYNSSGSFLLTYLASIAIVIFVLLLCRKIKSIPYLTYLGRYSIIVLVSHLLLGSFLNKVMMKANILNGQENIRDLCIFFIVLTLMAVVIPFCRTFLPHITAQKETFPTEKK